METIQHTYNLLPVSVYIAVWAYVWVNVITDSEGPMGFLYTRLEKSLPYWLLKPIAACDKCHGGQVALWFSVTSLIANFSFIGLWSMPLFIAQTILITLILSVCLSKITT
jgi:hypothetical protein